MKTFTVSAKTGKIAEQFDCLAQALLRAAELEKQYRIVQVIVNSTKRIISDSRPGHF
jgi:vacuolar-type H+-ATPase subunit D/Vma8